jgi:peroxiredoxin Q/BCP
MPALKTGDPAPDFSFTDHEGKTLKLSDFKGKKVILYFYPKDNTPGCTLEACSLRDGYEELRAMGYEVLGVSSDNEKSHDGFRKKFNLPFSLIPDTGKQIHMDYGVWGEKKFMGKTYMGTLRTTFVIDEDGSIARIIDKVDTKNHADQVKKEMEI